MSASTYIVLSFNLNAASGYCTHQAYQRFDDLSRAMTYGASELLIRDGVVILRTGDGTRPNKNLEPIAFCGAAETRAVALYVVADFKLGRWRIAERQGDNPPRERVAV